MAARVALRRLASRLLPAETSGRLARASIVSERGFATTQANELRVGAIVKRKDGALLEVTKYSYTQGQARGSGHVQVEYRDLRTGSKAQERLSPSDKLERAVLDSEDYDYIYAEGSTGTVMHPETFEQIEIPLSDLGPASRFLVEGGRIRVLSHEGERVSASMPEEVELEIKEAAPHVKGESKDAQFKSATTETGASVKVPPFVVAGDRVVVATGTGEFVRRAAKA